MSEVDSREGEARNNALFGTLETQRNQALNAVVQLQAEVAGLRRQIEVKDLAIAALKAERAGKAPDAPAADVPAAGGEGNVPAPPALPQDQPPTNRRRKPRMGKNKT